MDFSINSFELPGPLHEYRFMAHTLRDLAAAINRLPDSVQDSKLVMEDWNDSGFAGFETCIMSSHGIRLVVRSKRKEG
jgi:hypothetical protein